jgi:DNA-binding NtrC family response regulator
MLDTMSIVDTVVVVDISQDVRNFLRRALTYQHPEACLLDATTVAATQRILQTQPVTCVITNYALPDGSGLDVIAMIQAINPNIPIIGMSSSDVASVMLSAGAVGFLRKPFALGALFETLRRAEAYPRHHNHSSVTGQSRSNIAKHR